MDSKNRNTRIVASRSMTQWSGRRVPGSLPEKSDEGPRRIHVSTLPWYYMPEIGISVGQYRGCIVRRHRNRRDALRKRLRGLWPFLLSVRRTVFYNGVSPIFFRQCSELYTPPSSYTSGRSYSLSGCTPLCPPLVWAPVGSRWKCNSCHRRMKRVK